MNKYIAAALVLLLTAIGYKLRVNQYNLIPLPGQSTDEYSNAWVGLSLIQAGTPIGISGLDGYEAVDQRYLNPDQVFNSGATGGDPMAISYPWFDHPPLMPLIVGGWSYWRGARVFEDVTAAVVRQPALILGTVLIPLVFLLALQEFGLVAALIAAAITALSPLMVINSRMSQAEVALTPVFVGALIGLNHYLKTKARRFLWLAALLAGVAVLIKLSGIVVSLTLLVLIWSQKERQQNQLQQSLIILMPTLAGLAFFAAFGASLDWDQFTQVLGTNTGRKYGIGMNAIYELLTETRITNLKFLTDGWFLSGWLGLALLFANNRGQSTRLAILVYLAIYLLFGSEPYGWYRIPFLPLLIVAVSALVAAAFRNLKSWPLAMLCLLIPLGVNLSRLYPDQEPIIALFRWGNAVVILAGLALGGTRLVKPGVAAWVSRLLLVALLGLALATTLGYSRWITPQTWPQVT